LPRLYLPLLLLLCIAYAWRPIEGGFDIWAHAAVGKWIWANQQVPRESLFLWTAQGTPWIAHSWLSQLFFYGLLANGGPLAVVVFSTFMVTVVFLLLWKTMQHETTISFWMPLVFALAIWVSAPRFQPRQELISALFLVLTLSFLVAWSSGRFDDWLQHKGLLDASLVAIPIITLFFLWVNMHALIAVGLLLVLATVVADIAQSLFGADRFDAPARSRVLVLVAIAGFCVCATLLNPFGLKYWEAARVLQSGSQAQFVEEWKPLWKLADMWPYIFVQAGLFVVSVLAWLANPQRRWSHFLWMIFAAALIASSSRMLWIGAIIFLAIIAANAQYLDTPTLWRKWRKLSRGDQFEAIPDGLRHMAHLGTVICLVVWVFAAASRHTASDAGSWSTLVRNVPNSAVKYLASKPDTFRFFNDYEDSSYLQWRLNGATFGKPTQRGRHPLYIDLLNAYPDNLMFEYLLILEAKPSGIRQLQKRRINCIVLGEHHLKMTKDKFHRMRWETPLVKYLNAHPEWRVVSRDRQGIIWLRGKTNAR